MADWYYRSNGESLGPVNGSTLKRLATEGRLRPDDLVWRDGLATWIPARKVQNLIPAPTPEPPAPELDVFDLAEEPAPETPPRVQSVSAPARKPARPDSFFEPLPSHLSNVQSAEGLSTGARLGFGVLFLLIPGANVLLSSILYYLWRRDQPRKARQINTMGFLIFGTHILLAILIPAVVLMNKPRNLGGPVAVREPSGPPPFFGGMAEAEPPATPPGVYVPGQEISGPRYESPSGAFSINFPSTRWQPFHQNPNPAAEAMWKLQGREAYAMAVFEPAALTVDQLKQAALANIEALGATPEVVEDSMTEINGVPVARLVVDCNPEGLPLRYDNIYHSGPFGCLQLVTFCAEAEFPSLRSELESFQQGLQFHVPEMGEGGQNAGLLGPATLASHFESPSGVYEIDVPEGKWRPAPPAINPEAEGVWQRDGRDAFAMVIAEAPGFTRDELKDAVLINMRNAGGVPRLVSESTETLNGAEVQRLLIDCNLDGIPLSYIVLLYAGPEACIQVFTFSSTPDFPGLKPDFEEFLRGFKIR